jgi:prepilin-type processing-associated H-X9-DG protein
MEPFYNAGFRFSGNWGSTREPINKTPVTDSFYKLSNNAFFDCRASTEGGPHWVPNFRSFHPGGAGFLFCDGSVSFLNQNIAMPTYRGLSTIRGGEVVERP